MSFNRTPLNLGSKATFAVCVNDTVFSNIIFLIIVSSSLSFSNFALPFPFCLGISLTSSSSSLLLSSDSSSSGSSSSIGGAGPAVTACSGLDIITN